MTPDEIAEAFERARYEQLRGSVWADLREGERSARVEVARRALDQAGLTEAVAALEAEAARAAALDGIVAQRDAEIARRRAEHAEELSELRAATDATTSALTQERDATVAGLEQERDSAVADLEHQLSEVRAELDAALAHGTSADARADAAEALVAAVRTALSGKDVTAAEPQPDLAQEIEDNRLSPQDAAHAAANPRARFGRLARGAARA